jgi:Zn-dependent protease/predicted transcriptional regulator
VHESIHLGRVGGIRIGANWSLLVVVWLIAWSLADQQLPSSAPGHGRAAYWVVGVVASLAFFGCLLAHELAHSLLARRYGVKVTGIVLWLFGGVSQFEGDPLDATSELRIAAAGPATSVAVGAGFLAVSVGVDAAADARLVAAGFAWLGAINLLLAAFNLVPAFPLDGGRVLRAWLWRRKRDKAAATIEAARVGRWFAYLLIALGLLELAGGGLLGGVWFVFLGWFLLAAGNAESTSSMLVSQLGGLSARDAMSSDPVVVPSHATVEHIVDRWLYHHRASTFPVVDPDGTVVGLLTLARIKRIPPEDRAGTWVTDVAAPRSELVTCQVSDELAGVVARMNASRDQRALVYDGDRLVGIISPSDVTRVLERAELRPRSVR